MSSTPPVDLDHFEAVLFDLDGVLTATAPALPLEHQRTGVEINVESEISTYLLREGFHFTIWHQNQKVTLSRGAPRSFRNNP